MKNYIQDSIGLKDELLRIIQFSVVTSNHTVKNYCTE